MSHRVNQTLSISNYPNKMKVKGDMTLCLIGGAEGDDVAASGAASRPRFAEGKSMVTAFRPSASRN